MLLAGAVRVCSSWLREGKARRQERQPVCRLLSSHSSAPEPLIEDLEHCLSYIEAGAQEPGVKLLRLRRLEADQAVVLREDAAEVLQGLRCSGGSFRSRLFALNGGRENAEQIRLRRSASLTWHEPSSVRISPGGVPTASGSCFWFAVRACLVDRRSVEFCQERATRLNIRLWDVSGNT